MISLIESNFNELDLNKFINISKYTTSLKKNYKITASPYIFGDYDINQVFRLQKEHEDEYHYIYGLVLEFTRSLSTTDYNLYDMNSNNFISKADIYTIEITDLPKTF